MILAMAAAMLMQTPLPAAPEPVVYPEWVRRPSFEDMRRVYPEAASKDDLAGQVILQCRIGADGELAACDVGSVEPKDVAFEAAALSLSKLFRMRLKDARGEQVVGRTIRVPIGFMLPGDFRSATIPVRHPDVRGGMIEVDCRYRGAHLDNCFARGALNPKWSEIAVSMAEATSLPPMPRPSGRIVLPLLFAMQPAPVEPSPAGARPSVVANPDWRRRPSGEDLVRVYPAAAARNRIEGAAITICKVTKEGRLADCATENETPLHAGFGEAALKLMPLFLMRPQTRNGVPVDGGTVRIPIRFTLPR